MNDDDVIVTIDADGQHNPKDTPKLIRLTNHAQAVFGYRDFDTLPFRHKIANIVMIKFFNLLFRTDFKDLACGYNCFRRDAVKIIYPDLRSMHGGYNIEMQMKFLVLRHRLTYKQCKISCRYNEVSGFWRGLKMTTQIMLGTLRLRLQ